MIIEICSPKYGNHNIMIDDEDFDIIKKHTWSINNPTDEKKYARSSKHILLHRLIMNCPEGKHIDHINGNTLDNRKCNLRVCTQKDNAKNRKFNKNSGSGYRGVYWDKESNKWAVAISFDKKRIKLGRFKNKDVAAIAYNMAALKYHGDFARLNNVMEMKHVQQCL